MPVLTTYADDESLFPTLRAGVRGHLIKDASAEEIERRLVAAMVDERPSVGADGSPDDKTGARDRAQAVRYAHRRDIA